MSSRHLVRLELEVVIVGYGWGWDALASSEARAADGGHVVVVADG